VPIHDTEDTRWWYARGEEKEAFFISTIAPRLGITAARNPEKDTDPTAPDLLVDGKRAELKNQETPFFKAKKYYRVDPQFAVSFNLGDYEKYKEKYPEMDIFFWVDWQELEKFDIKLRQMFGVYRVPFKQLAYAIETGQVKLHEYDKRKWQTRLGINKDEKFSYGFDVRTFQCLVQEFPREEKLRAATAATTSS
jgi:hypothetical protein